MPYLALRCVLPDESEIWMTQNVLNDVKVLANPAISFFQYPGLRSLLSAVLTILRIAPRTSAPRLQISPLALNATRRSTRLNSLDASKSDENLQ